MVASLYTVYGSYLALKSFMGSFLTIIIIFLIILAAAILFMDYAMDMGCGCVNDCFSY